MTEQQGLRYPNKSKPGSLNPNWRDAGKHVCKNCGIEFRAYKKTRKYCSGKCYVAHRFDPATYLPVRQKKGRAIVQRSLPLKPPPKSATCLHCGAVIAGKPKRKYCDEHKSLGYSIAVKRIRATQPSRLEVRSCKQCGAEFSAHVSRPQKYCSYECFIDSGGPVRAGLAAARMTSMYGAKKDANHKDVVAVLRERQIPFIDLSPLGCGVPDLLVEVSGRLQLWEVKNLKTSYGKRGLNKNQKAWAENWRGSPIRLIHSREEAEAALEAAKVWC